MRIRHTLTALAGAAALALSVGTGLAATAAPQPTRADLPGVNNFIGVAASGNCSASLVRFSVSQPDDKAMIMTNGHCIGSPLPTGQYKFNQSANMQFSLLNAQGGNAGAVRSNRLMYATMTSTDIAFYQLAENYSEIQSKFNVTPLLITTGAPQAGASIVVASGYWKTLYPCRIDRTPVGIIGDASSDDWQAPAIGYSHQGACRTKAGTSGSPVLDATSGEVIAINNSGNDKNPGSCSGDATCEVDAQGRKTAYGPAGYATPVQYVNSCFNAQRQIDIKVPGCQLPGGDSAVKRPW